MQIGKLVLKEKQVYELSTLIPEISIIEIPSQLPRYNHQLSNFHIMNWLPVEDLEPFPTHSE